MVFVQYIGIVGPSFIFLDIVVQQAARNHGASTTEPGARLLFALNVPGFHGYLFIVIFSPQYECEHRYRQFYYAT